MNKTKDKKKKLERIFVIGDSMLPTFQSRTWLDVLPIENCTKADVEIGDIVTYWSQGYNRKGKHSFWHRGRCVHRIVGKTDSFALIKGDNRDYIEKVFYEKITGKVIGVSS